MQTIILQVTETINKVSTSAAEVATAKDATFLDLFLKGGYILIPLVMLSIIAVYLIIDKSIQIFKLSSIDKTLEIKLIDSVNSDQVSELTTMLKNREDSFSRIFYSLMFSKKNKIDEIEKHIENAANIEIAHMNKNLGYLSLIAGVAPMLGFIGTITGVIKIFYNISITDNISIGIISGGLYEKMISSGTGLFVGVLAFTGYHLLSTKIDHFAQEIESISFHYLNQLKSKE